VGRLLGQVRTCRTKAAVNPGADRCAARIAPDLEGEGDPVGEGDGDAGGLAGNDPGAGVAGDPIAARVENGAGEGAIEAIGEDEVELDPGLVAVEVDGLERLGAGGATPGRARALRGKRGPRGEPVAAGAEAAEAKTAGGVGPSAVGKHLLVDEKVRSRDRREIVEGGAGEADREAGDRFAGGRGYDPGDLASVIEAQLDRLVARVGLADLDPDQTRAAALVRVEGVEDVGAGVRSARTKSPPGPEIARGGRSRP
jgi:hypothetical protein